MPKLKFKHHELLTDDLTMVINGKRNAGKTTLLFNLLTIPGILDFNNLMIYSKTKNQYIYQFLEQGFKNNIKKEMINNLLAIYENDDDLQEDNIEAMINDTIQRFPDYIEKTNPITVNISDRIDDFDVTNLDKSKKNLMVFDDCSSNKDQAIQTKFFQNGRHFMCACIYLTHRFHEAELRAIKGNTAIFVLFEQPKKVLEQITRDINLGMENQEFYQLARKAWSVPKEKNYLFINPDLADDRILISPFRRYSK